MLFWSHNHYVVIITMNLFAFDGFFSLTLTVIDLVSFLVIMPGDLSLIASIIALLVFIKVDHIF